MSGFTQMFSFASDDDDAESREEPKRPPWFPPEDELGAVVPQGLVLAASERAVVALSHAVAFTTGVSFEFLALVRGLTQAQANRVFHEQHVFDEEGLPDAFLRLGFELADGARVSNLGGRHARARMARPDAQPDGPLLLPHGGGGGSGGAGRVTMRPGYWLWPVPPAGPLRISCEWPLAGIDLTTVEIDAATLADASARAQPLWPHDA